MATRIDKITKRWIRSAADEHAVANGCRMREDFGQHVIEFMHEYLRHSKGEWAGQPFDLMPWQVEDLIMPLFGWVRSDGTRRFRKAYVELPKKNGKSSLASALGLFMLLGDGEAGAEVYSAATDQQQASIVHGEAINMVNASTALLEVLEVNRTTKNIACPQTNSFYRALSAEAAGKEGLNAHCIIVDELHVWYGRKLWDALKYAFRSRRQGLLFVITTAGDDMNSVCREQHDYAAGVIDGTIPDDRFFGYIRAAGPEDDWTDPAVWRKANPSLGITIKEDEFAADVEEAKRSPTTQAAFKRYSLNIWATSTNAAIRPEDWAACRQEFSEHDLAGRTCYGGLDLAKTRDMTAFVLCFPDGPDRYLFLPYFWLPEDTANDSDAIEEYRVWVRNGFVRTTPGGVCDYAFVRRDILALSRQFDLREFAYDPYNAEETTQELENEHGLSRHLFSQTVPNFAEPTAEFERLVISGGLRHNGHPVLTWQAGHVCWRTDANGNKRPVKPPSSDHRKIDGIVAAIMALARAMQHREGEGRSVYDVAGSLAL